MKKEKQMFLWERHCGFLDFGTLFYDENMKKYEKIGENNRKYKIIRENKEKYNEFSR